MAGADLRGFVYELEPLRQRRQWEYDATLSRLAEVRSTMNSREAQREALHQECMAQSLLAAQAWKDRSDPAAQTRLLEYLSNLHRRRVEVEREIADLRQLLDQARLECVAQHRKLEVLERHRTDTLKDYISDQHRRSAAEADRDWAARSRQPSSGGAPA